MDKKDRMIWLLTLAILLVVALPVYHNEKKTENSPQIDSNSTAWEGEQQLPTAKQPTRGITLPCVTQLYFDANKSEQKVNFYNPPENDCNIQFVLTVDNQVIWESGLCPPGNGYYLIDISPLESGLYRAVLFYNCYSTAGNPLNSANITIDLIVQ